jgi:hypothetical protein
VTKKKEQKQTAAKAPPRQSMSEELPEFSFDQKKDLSERINNLTGDSLNTVVNIIQSSMPNLNGVGLFLTWHFGNGHLLQIFLIARTGRNCVGYRLAG